MPVGSPVSCSPSCSSSSLVLIRVSVSATPGDAGAWLSDNAQSVRLALDLLPFAGFAFLWFIGVLRDRMGAEEDRFFTTVFLGNWLLFLAMIFVSSPVTGGLMTERPANCEM